MVMLMILLMPCETLVDGLSAGKVGVCAHQHYEKAGFDLKLPSIMPLQHSSSSTTRGSEEHDNHLRYTVKAVK